jgi:1,4-dihydroxy-2-naphthoate octaprenyltransferase
MNVPKLRLFLQLTRPLFLIGTALLYALGAGIARYLGAAIDWNLYLLGQAWVTGLQLSAHYLNEFYDQASDADNTNRTPFSGGSGALGPGKLAPATAQLAGVTCLTITAALTVPLLQRAGFAPVLLLLLSLAFLGAFFYSAPPLRLSSSGYGELTTSILVANLVPALGFFLQFGDLHRLLAMATFPLTALHLAMMLAFEMPDYASDLKHLKATLLVRLGWERGMLLHNRLILAAFLLVGLAAGLGLPLAIALPAFMPLPLGLLQIWQMRRIAAGGKPNWAALGLNSVALLASTAYLLAFAFWTR